MIPQPIYESLPYVYTLGGLVAVVGVESALGKLCGLLLITAGIVIYQTRRRYRHRKLRPGDVESGKADGNSKRLTDTKRPDIAGEPVSQAKTKEQQHFQNGQDSYERGDYAAALKWYRKAADLGYAPAQVNLGSMYFEGQGIARDMQTALKWYLKAASQGYASAQFNLGMLYEQNGSPLQDFQEALRWYGKAADQGYAPAQVNLGSMYFEGQGVARDFQEALKWYREAADQGYAPAQFNLGAIYAEGHKGISKDPLMAYVWFSRSALLGDEDAQRAREKISARLTAEQKTQAQQLLKSVARDR